MSNLRIRDDTREHGPLDVTRDADGTIHLTGSSSGVTLGDDGDALLVAKCIEVVAGHRERSDLTPRERAKLAELQADNE